MRISGVLIGIWVTDLAFYWNSIAQEVFVPQL